MGCVGEPLGSLSSSWKFAVEAVLFYQHHRRASAGTERAPVPAARDHLCRRTAGDSASLLNLCLSAQTQNGSESVFLSGRAGSQGAELADSVPPALPAALGEVFGSRGCLFNGFILAGQAIEQGPEVLENVGDGEGGYLCAARLNWPKREAPHFLIFRCQK